MVSDKPGTVQFGKTNDSMVFLRPDKFVAAIAIPQISEQTSQAIFEKLGV